MHLSTKKYKYRYIIQITGDENTIFTSLYHDKPDFLFSLHWLTVVNKGQLPYAWLVKQCFNNQPFWIQICDYTFIHSAVDALQNNIKHPSGLAQYMRLADPCVKWMREIKHNKTKQWNRWWTTLEVRCVSIGWFVLYICLCKAEKQEEKWHCW